MIRMTVAPSKYGVIFISELRRHLVSEDATTSNVVYSSPGFEPMQQQRINLQVSDHRM